MADTQTTRGTFPGGRKLEIQRFLDEVGSATVTGLAERFGVSADTVRRDLEELQSEGSVHRSHGGARSTRSQSGSEYPLLQRLGVNDESKRRIGSRAADLIEDGMTVMLNGGSTILAVLPHLAARRELTLVTNNLHVAPSVPEACLRDLYLVGGRVRLMSQVTIGPVVFPSSQAGAGPHRIAADIALVAVGGVAAGAGFTTTGLDEARMMREFMDAAGRVVVLADTTKIGAKRFAQIAPLDVAHTLVTDEPISGQLHTALTEAEVTVLLPQDD